MDGLAGYDCWYRTIGRIDRHSLADELLRIPSADRVGIDVAVFVDVRNDETDLVGVAGVHHSQRRLWIANCDDIAMEIGADFIGEIGSVFADDFLDRLLVATGAGRFQY